MKVSLNQVERKVDSDWTKSRFRLNDAVNSWTLSWSQSKREVNSEQWADFVLLQLICFQSVRLQAWTPNIYWIIHTPVRSFAHGHVLKCMLFQYKSTLYTLRFIFHHLNFVKLAQVCLDLIHIISLSNSLSFF